MFSTFLLAMSLAQAEPDKGARDDVTTQAENVKRAKYNEIERGFSIRMPVGMMAYLTSVKNTATNTTRKFNPGMLMGLELGYDILPILDVGGFFYFAQSPGTGPATQAKIDMNNMFGGAFVRFSFFHTERVYLGVKAGGGYGVQSNLVQTANASPFAIAALTAEYFTRLRHFSLALDVGSVIWFTPISVALSVVPAVRWTL